MPDFWWSHGDLDCPLSRRDYLLYKVHRDWLVFSWLIYMSFCLALAFLGVAAWEWIVAGTGQALLVGLGFLFAAFTVMFWRGSRPLRERRDALSRGYPEHER